MTIFNVISHQGFTENMWVFLLYVGVFIMSFVKKTSFLSVYLLSFCWLRPIFSFRARVLPLINGCSWSNHVKKGIMIEKSVDCWGIKTFREKNNEIEEKGVCFYIMYVSFHVVTSLLLL